MPTFGKTGTTQDNRDAVFIGFAGNLVVGVWVGRDDDKSLGKISGGTVPARLWRDFMSSAISIDGQRGPALPRTYRAKARKQESGPARNPSPLPEEWSKDTEPLRKLARVIENMIEER